MCRLMLGALLLLTGCQMVGPVERNRTPAPRVDDPCLPIAEQQARARARLAYPDQSNNLAPRTGAEVPNAVPGH
jgi:hypothetical protein